jgi:hypothetical protein
MSRAVVFKVLSADSKISAISSQGYIYVMAALKFTYLLKVKEYCFVKNNRVTSLIGGVFISCEC